MSQTEERASAADAALIDEGATYSKDYWDLVLEQLAHRQLFKVGMWVLAVLYGLAIFAPLIGNDRPYKLVAVDYGEYGRALRSIEPFSRAVAQRVGAAEDAASLSAAADVSRRELDALDTRLRTLRLYLSDGDLAFVGEFERELADLEQALRASDVERAAQEAAALETAARELTLDLTPLRGGGADGGRGVELVPRTSYPLAEALGWSSVFFIVLWVLATGFPFWNRWWNRALLGGDRERIRRARRAKWTVMLGTPALMAVFWAFAIGGGAPAFDVAPFKRGLTDGTVVAAEAPLMAPVPLGYAEIHKEESYRPPTWIPSSRLDADGRYMTGLRVAKPDPITGYLPPATPVELLFAEPWPNAPHRHLAGTDELGRDFFVRLLWGARVSLAVGILSAGLLTVIGVVMGSIAGYFGGWVDVSIMLVIEILQSIPAFFLILAALAFIDPNEVGIPPIFIIVIVIAIVRWTGAARLVRGEFLKLREQEFVLASRALGFSNRRTIFRHVLPNALGPVLVSAAFAVAAGILLERLSQMKRRRR